jgi:superfamily II DNA helicase RecQ
MPYMICKKCDVYYEIADEDAEKDLKTCQCGFKMKYYEKLEDYLNSRDSGAKVNSLPVIDRLVIDYESAIARIVLQCLSEVTIDLGIKRFMLILKGKKSPFIEKYKLDKLKTYAMLSCFSEIQLRMIVDSITDKGFIVSEYRSEYEGSTLKITEIGKKFLNSYENIEIGFLKDYKKDKSFL